MIAAIPRRYAAGAAATALAVGLCATAGPAAAQAIAPQTAADARLAKVEAELARQARMIASQQGELAQLRAERDEALNAIRAGHATLAPARDPSIAWLDEPERATRVLTLDNDDLSLRAGAEPVGPRPAENGTQQQALAAAPPQMGVLTSKGTVIVDPSIEYDRTSADRLVFRGVEIVPGINLGVVEANRAQRNAAVATLAVRAGLTSRLEVEARVPWVYRADTVTTVAAVANNFQQTDSLYGHGLGDVEFAARYQLNYGANGWPIFVLTSRVKPPTGKGPYDVDYDVNAVAANLPTGSGFWAAEGGLTMLYPTDPAVLFGSLTYLHSFARDVDKTFGKEGSELHVGRVEPGDSIGAALGFGLSLNPRFSVSFGYNHNYIFPSTALEGSPGKSPLKSTSQALQVGSLALGWSFRLSDRLTLNNNLEMGVTSDAPDLQLIFRLPYRF